MQSNRGRDYLLYAVTYSFAKNVGWDYDVMVPDALLGTTLRDQPNHFFLRHPEQYRSPLELFIHSPSVLKPEKIEPDTSRIQKSDLWHTTKLAYGKVDGNNKKNISVPSMILNRQMGRGFTSGQKCRLTDERKRYFLVDGFDYKGTVSCGLHSGDGKYFLAATGDHNLRLHRSVNGMLDVVVTIPVYCEEASIVLDTVFSPDLKNFVYCGWSDCLYMCSINGGPRCQDALQLSPKTNGHFCVSSVAFSNDGNEIIASSNDGHLYVYDLGKQQQTLAMIAYSRNANAVRFADNTSQILITGGENGLCKVWDRRTLDECESKPVGVLAGHSNAITYIDPRGDGRHFITNSKDQTIKLWDMRVFSKTTANGNALRPSVRTSFKRRTPPIRPRRAREIRSPVQDTTSIMTYRGHSVLNTLMRCRFSPAATTGQKYIYTGSGDGSVIIYDVLTGKKGSCIERFGDTCVRDVSWHPYQPHLVSSSWDGWIETWAPVLLW